MSSELMEHRLPPEITDDIIDHLRNDKRGLRACNLVCKAWSLRARYLLFSDVVITQRNARATATLGSAIISCIRNVRFRLLRSGLWQEVLEPLAGVKFENAVSLTLEASIRDTLLYFETLHNLTPNIVQLRVTSLGLGTIQSFTDFICAFRHLKKLAVNCLYCVETTRLPKQSMTLCLPDTLRVIEVPDDKLTRWLLSFKQLPPIHTFNRISYALGIHDVPTSVLLRTLGPSLEAVDIPCDNQTGYQSIDLAHNTYLRSLHLQVRWVDKTASQRIIHTLSQVVSTRMDTVSLTLTRRKYDAFDALEWGKIDEALAQLTFSKLRLVDIAVFSSPWSAPDRDLRASIIGQLQACHARNILLVRNIPQRCR